MSSEEEVQFEQVTAAVNTYRDAVSFRNGRKVPLQQLPEGQEVTVLSLGEVEAAGETEPFRLVRNAA